MRRSETASSIEPYPGSGTEYETPPVLAPDEELFRVKMDPECSWRPFSKISRFLEVQAALSLASGGDEGSVRPDPALPPILSDHLPEEELEAARRSVREALQAAAGGDDGEESSLWGGGRSNGRNTTTFGLPADHTLGPMLRHCHRGKVASILPAKRRSRGPLPLMVHLHGCGQSPEALITQFNFPAAGELDRSDALHVIPYGKSYRVETQNKTIYNARVWHTGEGTCCDYMCRQDDVDFIYEVIRATVAKYDVDDSRIYVVGYSNGGFLAHRLACELSGIVAGVVTFAAAITGFCEPSRPVPVLSIWGDADDVVQYHGGRIAGRLGVPYVGAIGSLCTWAEINNCSTNLTTKNLDLLPTGDDDAETSVIRFSDCGLNGSKEGVAELWTLPKQTHKIQAWLRSDGGERLSIVRNAFRWLLQFRREPIVKLRSAAPAAAASSSSPPDYGPSWTKADCLARS